MKKTAGSLTVEASLVVPLVFVLLLPFLYILRSVYVYDSVQSAVTETAELLEPIFYLTVKIPDSKDDNANDHVETTQAESEVQGLNSLLQTLTGYGGENSVSVLAQNLALQQITKGFVNELLQENALEKHGLSGGPGGISYMLSNFSLTRGNRENLFRITAFYERDFPFASSFVRLNPVFISVTGRKYVGQETIGEAEEAGNSGDSEEKIYYRIQNGTHYHIASCYLLDKSIRTMSKAEAEAKGYTACGYCHASTLSAVVVTEGGTRYHAADCYHVGGAACRITWEEIQQNGYAPCAICIGGGTWFG